VYTDSTSGIIDDYVRSIAIDGNGDVWAGCNDGLSKFDGSSWTTYTVFNSGLPSAGINAVAIDRNGLTWTGTDNGLASISQSAGTINPTHCPSPRSLSAHNYPNPFTHSTTIEYTVPKEGHVSLRIFTARGEAVALLADENKKAGKHFVQWNSSIGVRGHLPQGVYIGDFVCGGQHTAWKMYLVR